MCRITSWGDIWSRLWVELPEVGDGKERGLSAGYALFLIFGVVCDFMLNKIFGECPDEVCYIPSFPQGKLTIIDTRNGTLT
jgi:hypothetical protein